MLFGFFILPFHVLSETELNGADDKEGQKGTNHDEDGCLLFRCRHDGVDDFCATNGRPSFT